MGTTDEMESVDWRRFLSERDGQLDTCFPFGDPCICLAADEQDLSDDVLAMMERLALSAAVQDSRSDVGIRRGEFFSLPCGEVRMPWISTAA